MALCKKCLESVTDCLHLRRVKFLHVSWSYYGHIIMHNIITNPRSHNSIIINNKQVQTCTINQLAIALILTIYTIHLLASLDPIYTNYHSHRSTQLVQDNEDVGWYGWCRQRRKHIHLITFWCYQIHHKISNLFYILISNAVSTILSSYSILFWVCVIYTNILFHPTSFRYPVFLYEWLFVYIGSNEVNKWIVCVKYNCQLVVLHVWTYYLIMILCMTTRIGDYVVHHDMTIIWPWYVQTSYVLNVNNQPRILHPIFAQHHIDLSIFKTD